MNDNQDNLQGPASLPTNNQYQPQIPPIDASKSPGVPPPPPTTSPVMPSPISPATPNAPAPQFSPITPNVSSTTPPNFSARTSSAVPPPPAPDIGIRTMASDLSSLKSTGGLEAKPATFQPADFANTQVFHPSKAAPASGGATATAQSHRSRLSMIIAVSIAFIIVAGLVIYFFILPLVYPAKNNAPTTTTTTTTTPTEQTPPAASAPVATPQLTHKTFFVTAPTSTSAVNLTTLTLGEIQTTFTAAVSSVQPKTLTEINLNLNNSPVDATAFMVVAFPELDQAVIGANFDKDMTTFVYKDTNGSWPGYIFKLKDPASLTNVSTAVKGIESSSNLQNLFLTSPGAAKGGFKDGLTVGTTKARYITYTASGASINYAWFNNYLVVSTSFNGFKEALKLLGLSS